jgi:protein phosphatase
MLVELPENCLVVLIGASGSGKSTFAEKLFLPSEILSSDAIREMISDDPLDISANPLTFRCLRELLSARLRLGRFTVIDATNTKSRDRADYVKMARSNDFYSFVIVLNPGLETALTRNRERRGRKPTPDAVVKRQYGELLAELGSLEEEGFDGGHFLERQEDIDSLVIERLKPSNDLKDISGPFDVIGDVHGCFTELTELLGSLGYVVDREKCEAFHPDGRKIVFLGNLANLGPQVTKTLKLSINMVKNKNAFFVPGDHEEELRKYLSGEGEKTESLTETLNSLKTEPPEFGAELSDFLANLISHYVFDGGKLVVAHCGIPQRYQGRTSERVRSFCVRGPNGQDLSEGPESSERDAKSKNGGDDSDHDRDWIASYHGRALVLYGHYADPKLTKTNNTLCLDTGCVFGGKLTAYRYPENEIVSVAAKKVYYKNGKTS